jgi:glycosyltransferase involved in cell wall biosynthesis
MSAPAVSVLLPVHNGASYLSEAVASILRQTYADFELLVVNDGSTDGTASILRNCADYRLTVIENERNLGVIPSLNRGLITARSEFVARMDADDIAFPERLRRQVDFLHGHPQVGLCGTWFQTFGTARPKAVRPPTQPEDLAARLFYESPLAHSSVMFRRALFVDHGLQYSLDYPHAEDYELWVRTAEFTGLANVPEVLLQYRQHGEQMSNRKTAEQNATVRKILVRQLRKIHPEADAIECDKHVTIFRDWLSEKAGIDVNYVETWLRLLVARNESAGCPFPRDAFRRALGIVWWRYCSVRLATRGMLSAFYASEFARALPLRNRLGIIALRAKAMAVLS